MQESESSFQFKHQKLLSQRASKGANLEIYRWMELRLFSNLIKMDFHMHSSSCADRDGKPFETDKMQSVSS